MDSCYFTSKRVHPSMNRFTSKSHSFNFSWKQKVFFLIGLLYENAVIFSKKLDSLVCLKFVALWILTKPLNKTCLCVSSRGLSIGFTVQRKYFCLLSRYLSVALVCETGITRLIWSVRVGSDLHTNSKPKKNKIKSVYERWQVSE